MTREAPRDADEAARDEGTSSAPGVVLPLVSVIVVNYNYGRYLTDAVASVYGQSYVNVECIVVDNASTDETPVVLAALRLRFPALRVIERAANDGQTPASLDGLAACAGRYVIFLDADDFLLRECVETHIYAHLSMRPHVAFSSGDMLQVADDEVVVATGEESNRFVKRGWRRKPHLVRPFEAKPGWPSAALAAALPDQIHYVRPLTVRWVWSPTSGLCYRRDALALFADNARLATLRTGTDLYFAFGCGGLSGSIVIDAPVFAYRIHGGNIFTAHAQLDRTLNYTIGGGGDSNIKAQLYLVDHLVARVERFTPNFWLTLHYAALLLLVDRRDPAPGRPGWARRSRAAQAIVRHYDHVCATLGPAGTRLLFVLAAKSLRAPQALRRSLDDTI